VALIRRSVTALSLVIALGGCYNAAHHAIAQSVEGSFKELHIGDSLNAERELSRELLKRELEAVARQQEANRDLALAEAIDSDWDTFRQSIHDRAKELFGDRVALADLGAAAGAIEEWKDQQEELKRREKRLREELSAEVTCPLPSGMKRPAGAGMQALLEGYENACRQTTEAMTKVRAAGGDLAEIRERIRKQEDEIQSWQEKSRVAKERYLAAVRDYERKVYASRTAAGELERRRTAIEAALAQMHAAGPIGQLEEIEARHVRIQALMKDRKDKGSRPEGPETVAEVVAGSVLTVPLIQSSQGPALLELEAQRLQSDRAAAHARRLSAETRLKLLYAERDALFSGVLRLSEASAAAEKASTLQGPPAAAPPAKEPRRKPAPPEPPAATAASKCVEGSLTVARNFAQSTGPCRVAIARALIGYSELWTMGRIPAAQARWMALGVLHEQTIDESIATLEQWENVLETPISQLVQYHASGVKPDTLAQLMFQAAQALAVGAIAASVAAP
jgi:hypothetical protein